jgi:hypothetical protein
MGTGVSTGPDGRKRSSTGANPSLISGIGGAIKDFFGNRDKPIRSDTEKPTPRDIQPQYKFDEKIDKRLLGLADYYYREGSFEKIQFARKWMRNALIYQGYHELEWSEINVAWDIILQDSGDYAFPNNYYRSLIRQGVRAYVQNEPLMEPVPSNDDAEAQAAAKAARTALEIIKKGVKYDQIRVEEALNLRLFGNSFRFNYFSKDPRHGYVTSPVYQDANVLLSPGASVCDLCGPLEGNFSQCPGCQTPISKTMPPVVSKLPFVSGSVRYPKGEICTEVVNPLEIYLRSSSYDLWHAPFIVRNRVVDRLALQSAYPDIALAPRGDEGGGEAYSTGGDLGLIYLQSLADLPGDPTQYAAWYERATAAAKALLIECWLRPSIYFFDKELLRRFPDGLYIGKTGNILLEARNESIDDHWTHYVFNKVPGRIWGDGDDDLIPPQLKLDESDRLIQRNQGYNSVPLLAIDSQRMDKNEIINDPSSIIEVKSAGRPVRDAFETIKAQPLTQETWQWRAAHLGDMQFHAQISPAAMGQHETGTNTFGGQESAAAKSDNSLLPNLMLWKVSDETWAKQALKLASQNWIDARVRSVNGINGRWEFEKLRGAALDMDKFTIETRILPIDPAEQESFSQAVAAGVLNPQDPRVVRKALDLWHLDSQLDTNYEDTKKQWKEIEQMKQSVNQANPQEWATALAKRQMGAMMSQQTGQPAPQVPLPGQIQPVLIRDNDMAHIQVCRTWMNSDEADDNPQLNQLVLEHAQLHMMNAAKSQMMMAAIQGGGGGEGGAPQQPQKQPEGGAENKQQRGGQVPKSPQVRQQRAEKGQAARPNKPQPSSGNQYHRKRLT